MRKGIAAVLMLLFCFPFIISAETIMSVDEFRGGKMDFRAAFQSDFIYGGRGDGLRNGGTVSTLDQHMSFTSYNPACLAFMERAYVSMALIPASLGVDSGFIKDVSGQRVMDMVNDALEGATESMTRTAGVEFKINGAAAWLGQPPGIMGLEAALPFASDNAGVGIAREEKATIELTAVMSGMEVLVGITDDTNPAIDMALRAKVNAFMDADLRNVVTSFGLGRKITPIWGIGFAVDKYESSYVLNAAAEPDAAAVFAGNTYEFNTSDINSLKAQAKGELKAEAWGLRFGTALHSFEHNVETAIDFSIQPELKFNGSPDIFYHTMPSEIDVSDVTKTQKETVDGADIRIKIPSFMRVTLAWKPGAVIVLNYTRYFDPLYIDFGDGRAYMDMRDAFRLGFNFGGFQIGGGVMLSRLGSEFTDDNGKTEKQQMWFPVPVLSTGCVIPFGKNLEAEMEFLALPLPFLKSAVTYNF